MKKTSKKILSVVLAVITLLSLTTVLASAKPSKPIGYIEGLPVKAKYDLTLGEFMDIPTTRGATSYNAYWMGDNNYSVSVQFDDFGNAESFFAAEEGVALMEIFAYKDYEYYEDGEIWNDYELIEDYFVIVVVHPRKGSYYMGEVTEAYMPDMKINYKDEIWAYPDIWSADDEGAYFCTYFVNYDCESAFLDEDGYTHGFAKGTDNCACYVIDAQGNIFESDFSITVKYSFWQWIIRILLFGWIWY